MSNRLLFSTQKTAVWLFALACIVLFTMSGCASGGGAEETNPSASGTEQTAGSSESSQESNASGNSSSHIVEHAMGKTEVPERPERVVVLTNEGLEALLALGVKPVGAVEAFTGDPWYDHLADQMDGVEVVGTELAPNLETITALEPDLIIGNKLRHEQIYEQLNAIAPTVFAETLRGNWKINFELYAKAVNQEEKGKELLAAYDQRIAQLREKFKDQLEMKLSVVRFMPGDVRIYHKDSFTGVIFEEIGFARPESQDVDDFAERNVTKERIHAMDGDILFYFTYETGDGEASKLEEEWVNDPLWKNLPVVQKGHVHKVDDVIWNTAGGIIAANLMLDQLEEIMVQYQ